MPAQVPVRNAHGAFVPQHCHFKLASSTRLQSSSRSSNCATSRTCRLQVAAGQRVNQLEASEAAEATPKPQEQSNGSTDPRQKAQQRGTRVFALVSMAHCGC